MVDHDLVTTHVLWMQPVASGIGQATNLKFTLDLVGEKKDVTVDTTDIGSW